MNKATANDKPFSIRQVSVSEIYAIRQRNLRAGKPIETVHFTGDDLLSTIHFALFEEDVLVGCASLMLSNNSVFAETDQYQLRGMAVDAPFRNKGYGTALLRYAEWLALNRRHDFIWFNARCDVQGFYTSNGYTAIGESFMIPDVCMHVVMCKKITPHVCSSCAKSDCALQKSKGE